MFGTYDDELYVSQNDSSVPTRSESEALIKAKAPDAIKTLVKRDALDLLDILGLTPYAEGAH